MTGWKLITLFIVGVVILGPERLPHYASRLGSLARQASAALDQVRGHLRAEMGPTFDEIDWRQYDPRQYDPRRIVREALLEPSLTQHLEETMSSHIVSERDET